MLTGPNPVLCLSAHIIDMMGMALIFIEYTKGQKHFTKLYYFMSWA